MKYEDSIDTLIRFTVDTMATSFREKRYHSRSGHTQDQKTQEMLFCKTVLTGPVGCSETTIGGYRFILMPNLSYSREKTKTLLSVSREDQVQAELVRNLKGSCLAPVNKSNS